MGDRGKAGNSDCSRVRPKSTSKRRRHGLSYWAFAEHGSARFEEHSGTGVEDNPNRLLNGRTTEQLYKRSCKPG